MDRTFGHIGGALENWLLGQLVSMTLVGVLTGIALSIIGLPSTFALALIAGLTEFIPLLGPILGGIPAVLVASGEGSSQVLWTLAAILAVQQIESNMITPIVQRKSGLASGGAHSFRSSCFRSPFRDHGSPCSDAARCGRICCRH